MANYSVITSVICYVIIMTSLTSARHSENSCAIYSGGCAFHVVLAGRDCGSQTGSNIPISGSLQSDDPKALYGYNPSSQNDINKESLQLEKVMRDELETNSKRLTELDEKLTKMMEGLSVRSLRHFRKIKSDMDLIAASVKSMSEHETEKGGRSERSTDRCPPEFMTVGSWSSCYRFSNFNETWSEAKEFCSAFGANLVSIENEKEFYILDGLIKSNPHLQEPKGWWTAGNYVARSQQWVWAGRRNVKPMDRGYTHWDVNEPNARSTMHCMLMYKHADYKWHDGTCSDKHNFVCEMGVNDWSKGGGHGHK